MNKIHLVSYPRSGNTWVRFLIANIQSPESDIGYRELDKLVPDIHQEQAWRGEKFDWSPVVFKSHDVVRDDYEEAIYLYRDGRDVALSCYYFYQGEWNNSQWRIQGSFEDYLKKFIEGWNSYGGWKEHVNFWFFVKHKVETLFIRYEDLLLNPLYAMRRIVNFLNIDAADEAITHAIEKSKYGRLKERAPADGQHPYSYGTKGKSGGWKDAFTEKQKQMFWDYAGDLMEKLGYDYDEEIKNWTHPNDLANSIKKKET